MSNARNLKILALGISLALAAGSASATNGYFTHSVGTKGKAQAGAGSANPEELLSIATNPAGLAFLPESFDAGLGFFSPMRDYKTGPSQLNGTCFVPPGGTAPFCPFTIGPNDMSSENELFPVPFLGMNWKLDEQSAVGLAFYGRGGMNTQWEGGTASFDPTVLFTGVPTVPAPTFPGTYGGGFDGGNGDAGVDFMQGFLNLTYGWKSADDHFGLGASAIFALQRFQARGVGAFAPYTETFVRSFCTSTGCGPSPTLQSPRNLSGNGHDMSYGYGLSFGAIWNPVDMLSLAVAYTTKLSMGDFGKYKDLFAESGGFDVPSTGTIGVTVRPTDAWALSFDVQEIWYSDVASVNNPIQNLFNCPILGGSDYESCLGGNRGGGFGWEDMTVYKFGGVWKYSDDWTFRAGYSFADQPIPKDQMTFNILAPGVMEQHWTFGFTNQLSGGDEWSLSFMYAPENKISGPNNFDPTQRVELSMQQFELEFSYSWR
jgi:long-chain fatty acid transport protein